MEGDGWRRTWGKVRAVLAEKKTGSCREGVGRPTFTEGKLGCFKIKQLLQTYSGVSLKLSHLEALRGD